MHKQGSTLPLAFTTEPNLAQEMYLAMLAGYNLSRPAEQILLSGASEPGKAIPVAVPNSPKGLAAFQPVAAGSTVILRLHGGIGTGVYANLSEMSRQSNYDLLVELARELSPKSLKEVLEYAYTVKRQADHKIRPEKKKRLKIARIREA